MRFTFTGQDKELTCLQDKRYINRCKLIYKALIDKIISLDYLYLGTYTAGFETQNRAGEDCYAHIHIRFKSTNLVASMRRQIKRYLEEQWDQDTQGNHAMMFKHKPPERGDDIFFQYCLKQDPNPLYGGIPRTNFEILKQASRSSYAVAVQVAQSKLDKKDNADTLFLKVIEKIKRSHPDNNISCRQILVSFIQHYQDELKPINRTTIEGYTITAQLHLGLLSPEDLADTWRY